VKISKEELENIIVDSASINEVHKRLPSFFAYSGTGRNKLINLIKEYQISTSHFSIEKSLAKRRKYPLVTKNCPVCNKEFQARIGEPKEKRTCSYSCSNIHFAEKRAKTEELKSYRTICFRFYEEKCSVCPFDKVIEVHHLDENRENNEIKNLIPLCPNHHRMIHVPEYKQEILLKVLEVQALTLTKELLD